MSIKNLENNLVLQAGIANKNWSENLPHCISQDMKHVEEIPVLVSGQLKHN